MVVPEVVVVLVVVVGRVVVVRMAVVARVLVVGVVVVRVVVVAVVRVVAHLHSSEHSRRCTLWLWGDSPRCTPHRSIPRTWELGSSHKHRTPMRWIY